MLQELLHNQKIIIGALISIAISCLTAIYYFLKLRAYKEASSNKGYVMQVIPPKYILDEESNKQGTRFALQRFIDNLTASTLGQRISLEIFADDEGVRFLIWTPTKRIQELVKQNLYSTYNERIKIKKLDHDPAEYFYKGLAEINEYKTKKHDIYMLMDLKDFEAVDPIQDILGSMIALDDNEKVLFQIVLKPTKLDKVAFRKAKENFRLGKAEITWFSTFLDHLEVYLLYFIPLLPVLVLKLLSGLVSTLTLKPNSTDPMLALIDSDPRKVLVPQEDLKDFSTRINEKYKTAFTTYIRVVATGKNSYDRLKAVEQGLESMKSETQNRLVKRKTNKLLNLQHRFLYPESQIFPFYKELFTAQNTLSSREVSMLYHLPQRIIDPSIDHFSSPNIAAKKKYREKENNSDLLFGLNTRREQTFDVFLSAENRKRHLVVNGQTGTGKSTILKNFVLQDIDNRLLEGGKRGLMLLDPHEDFFTDILERLPKEFTRTSNLIPWDTRSEDSYFGFNPLFAVGLSEREIDLIVDSNFKLIEKLIKRSNPDAGMGATGKPMLINGMKTLMVFQNEWLRKNGDSEENKRFISKSAPTLIDVKNLFGTEEFKQSILDTIDLNSYEDLRLFWENTFPNYSESDNWPDIRQGFDNKLSQILTGVLLYTFAQSQSSIDIGEIVRKSKILLVNLSSKNIGEEGMSLLGSLLMAKVWFEAKKVPQYKRNPFVVYADEFQNFATSDFSSALSEARKFKLELILAHQFFRQLPDDVFHAVMGNVKSKVYYRCGLEDAEMIAKELQGKVLENEVMEIPEFHANVKVGEDTFSINVAQEREPNFSQNFVEGLIEDSYKAYGQKKSQIETQIRQRREWIEDGCKVTTMLPTGNQEE